MSSWPPPAVLPDLPGQERAAFDARARRQEIRSAFWWACIGAVALTVVVVVAGWLVIAETTEPNPDSDMNGLAYIAWLMFAPLMSWPLFTWALTTHSWRNLDGPSRVARVCAAIGLLVVPAVTIPAVIVTVWFDSDEFQARLVNGFVLAPCLVGVLVTGRLLRARHALLLLGLIAIAAIVGFQYASATTDDRLEADIRDELAATSIPLALPTPSSGWVAQSWMADQRWDPDGEPGDDERWVARLRLVGNGLTEVSFEMWDAPAEWYCADVPCSPTGIAIDGAQVLRYQGRDGWEHEVLPRGDRAWVLTHIDPIPDATVEQMLTTLEPVTADEWAEAVAPLPRT